ncbi:MAG TPA: sigma-E factor regulatory protein RseB domain-containing protein, partial [Anaerolineaceae bacterium]|nr:sigma-E factor regulatory protein RseB domain-containing protein [Anaerolineaceae bacterium]
MHPNETGRSPDIEWLLQSGEASPKTILQFLLNTYYESSGRFAFALYGESKPALHAVVETFGKALRAKQRYPGEKSVLAWLDEFTIRDFENEARKLRIGSDPSARKWLRGKNAPTDPDDSLWKTWLNLEAIFRTPFALRAIHGMDPPEIAGILCLPVETVESRLELAGRGLAQTIWDARGDDLPAVQTEFLRVLEQRWLDSGLAWQHHGQLAELIEQRAERQAFVKHLLHGAWQVAIAVGALFIIWGAVSSIQKGSLIARTPNKNATAPANLAVARDARLSEASQANEIIQKAAGSGHTWNTLWADALIVDYGPPGYIGPPRTYRNQIWYRQPGDALIFGGPLEGAPDYMRQIQPDRVIDVNLATGDVAEYDRAKDPLANGHQLTLSKLSWTAPFGFYLQSLIQGSRISDIPFEIQTIGMDTAAGREALVIEQPGWKTRRDYRLWIDTQTGLPLRWWTFDPEGSQAVTSEARIISLALNFDFPAGFFPPEDSELDEGTISATTTPRLEGTLWEDLWQPVETDETPANAGMLPPPGREIRSVAPAPPGFDPAESRLTFRWSTDPQDRDQPGETAEIIAGDYSLGSVALGNPWHLFCMRSPDGRAIAYANAFLPPEYDTRGLRWLRLSDPETVY